MTISFNNITLVLAAETKRLKEKAPNEAGVHCWMDNEHQVHVVMNRVLIDDGELREVQKSAYKVVAVKDIAKVTINPHNEELCGIITKYFLSEKIPGFLSSPERLFFDEVLINAISVIR